jgi:hypothetical protein
MPEMYMLAYGYVQLCVIMLADNVCSNTNGEYIVFILCKEMPDLTYNWLLFVVKLVIGLPINTADACSSVWQVELALDICFVYIGQKTSMTFRNC